MWIERDGERGSEEPIFLLNEPYLVFAVASGRGYESFGCAGHCKLPAVGAEIEALGPPDWQIDVSMEDIEEARETRLRHLRQTAGCEKIRVDSTIHEFAASASQLGEKEVRTVRDRSGAEVAQLWREGQVVGEGSSSELVIRNLTRCNIVVNVAASATDKGAPHAEPVELEVFPLLENSLRLDSPELSRVEITWCLSTWVPALERLERCRRTNR